MAACTDHTYVCSRLSVIEERGTSQATALARIEAALERLDERQRTLTSRLQYWGGGIAVLVALAAMLSRVIL
jgi:hypothetical protein